MAEKILWKCIENLDVQGTRKLIDEYYEFIGADFVDEDGNSLLHKLAILHSNSITNEIVTAKQQFVYILCDAGINIDQKNALDQTALEIAVENADSHLCGVLLQCGADMHLPVKKVGCTLLNYVLSSDIYNVKHVFEKYQPGLWNAVASADISEVRQLVNLWCRTDLVKDGVSLQQLALATGQEDVISLILGTEASMRLVHHVLAGNVKGVKKMLENGHNKVQLDFRNLSHRGAPLLYYVIQSQQVEIARLLISSGCHIYTIMRDKEGCDMPVLFSALEMSSISVDIIDALLPKHKDKQEELLYRLLYKGKTVLEVALLNNINLDVFDLLVDRCGPMLVADRDRMNRNIHDLAVLSGMSAYVEVIDKNIIQWLAYPDMHPGRRKTLALRGYDFSAEPDIRKDPIIQNSPEAMRFLEHIDLYQDQISKLADAVAAGDVESFESLHIFKADSNTDEDLFESELSWDARPKNDGLPLLHLATIHNHAELVEKILQYKPPGQSIDTLFDQLRRTALHYAYGLQEGSSIRKVLLSYGCSEHTLDKNGKEPLDFRDKQGSPLMKDLIERLRNGRYHQSEPDVWSDQLIWGITNFSAEGECDCKISRFVENYFIDDEDAAEDYDGDDNDAENESRRIMNWPCNIV